MISVLDSQTVARVVVTFYVKEDASSPYQGRLEFSPADYAALSAADLKTQQLAQYAAWKGSQPPPPDPNAIPTTITLAQARKAILAAGLKDAVEAAVAGADAATQALWYSADGTLSINDPILKALAAQIGLSDAQLKALFQQAANL